MEVHEIDYVGTGTFQLSQLNVLNKRSCEPFKTSEAILSARGLHHRPRDVFVRDIQATSGVISNLKRREKMSNVKTAISSQLIHPCFQRALALERLNNLNKAIEDYSTCIRVDPSYAPAYFNRAGLYKAQRDLTKAMADLNKAVELDPSNVDYRLNRALLARETGQYHEAVKDTILSRALQNQPNLGKLLEAGEEISIDGELAYVSKLADDPILLALEKPGADREDADKGPIIDYLRGLKFFSAFQNNREILDQVASRVELMNFNKGDIIFNEGDPGNHFYMILDGEVSIIRVRKDAEEVDHTIVLVRMFRGQTFGETALESKGGLRTAGAMASQNSRLLSLHAEEYNTILSSYRSLLKEEVRAILASSLLFQEWDPEKIDYLASLAIVRNFDANAEIMKANEPVSSLMMIKSGIVQLIKSIPRQVIGNLKRSVTEEAVLNNHAEEVPGLWILPKNRRHRLEEEAHMNRMTTDFVDFCVGILGSGQVFGELSVLDPEQHSPVSAVSSTAVEIYCFESDVLLATGARFNTTTMKALNESLTLHDPPVEKIAYYFRSKYNWELRKDKLMNRFKHAGSP